MTRSSKKSFKLGWKTITGIVAAAAVVVAAVFTGKKIKQKKENP